MFREDILQIPDNGSETGGGASFHGGRVPSFLLTANRFPVHGRPVRFRRPLVDRALERIGSVITATYVQWESASKRGLLQSVDSRVKLLCMIFLLGVATVRNSLASALVLAGFLFLLALLSRLDLFVFYRRVSILAFLFGFLIALPAAFNIFTEGRIVLPLVAFQHPPVFVSYSVPPVIGITAEGLQIVLRLSLRVMNCLSVSFLLLYTTPLPQIVRSLKVLKIPDTLLVVIVLTYKYIFIFSTALEDMYLAMKSRVAEPMKGRETGNWTAGRIASVFRRTQGRCEELFHAMVSRGLTGEIVLIAPDRLKPRDLWIGICLAASGGVLLWI